MNLIPGHPRKPTCNAVGELRTKHQCSKVASMLRIERINWINSCGDVALCTMGTIRFDPSHPEQCV